MKLGGITNRILLIASIIAIFGLIAYFESTKPELVKTVSDADIIIEELNLPSNETDITETPGLSDADKERIESKAEKYGRAKELVGPEGYINTEPFTLAEHIGKEVILIDFWTYSCINCQRTLPYLTSWHDTYSDDGLLIVGVHTPEFGFEEDYDNVVKATEKWGVKYPVVQDNDRQTWSAYKNRYWPRKYMIDIDGFIVYDHIGEGGYAETELKIRELLFERKEVLKIEGEFNTGISYVSTQAPDFQRIGTPEIYFGYGFERGDQLGNSEGWQPDKTIEYTFPKTFADNKLYLEGTWKSHYDDMEAISNFNIVKINYESRIINLVAGANTSTNISVYVDNELTKQIEISGFDLYEIHDGLGYSKHDLRLEVPKGVMLYTFTFG